MIMNMLRRGWRSKHWQMKEYPYFRSEFQQKPDYFLLEYSKVSSVFSELNIKIKSVKKDTDIIKVFDDTIIEENATYFCGLILNTMLSRSYSHSAFRHGISVGRYCSIAGRCRIFDGRHHIDWISTSPSFMIPSLYSKHIGNLTYFERSAIKLNISNDVWIGSDVAFAQNITVGDGAVIGSGAIVTKNVPPFTVVVGVPARIIKFRFSDKIIERILRLQWWNYNFHDIKSLNCDDPKQFLDKLEDKIKNKEIVEYKPKYVNMNDYKKYSIDKK